MFKKKFQSPLKNYLIEVEAGLAEPPSNFANLVDDYAKAISSNPNERFGCIKKGLHHDVLNWLVLDPDFGVRRRAIYCGGLPPIGSQEAWPNWENIELHTLLFKELIAYDLSDACHWSLLYQSYFESENCYRQTAAGKEHFKKIKSDLIEHTLSTKEHLLICEGLIRFDMVDEEQSLTLLAMGKKKINTLLARHTPYHAVLERLQHSTKTTIAELATNRLLSQRLTILSKASSPGIT